MNMIRTPKISRGEVYYIRFDDSYGGEESVGRPVVVVSAGAENVSSPTYNVLPMTTNPRPVGICVKVASTRRDSFVLCNQIKTYDSFRFGDYMCSLSEEEMRKVDDALARALGLNLYDPEAELRHEEEMRDTIEDYQQRLTAQETAHAKVVKELKDTVLSSGVERDLYKKLYDKTLELLADLTLSRKLGEKPPVKEEPVVEVVDVVESKRVNINTATAKEIQAKTGIGATVAYSITGYRNKHGLYSSVEDLLNVPRFGKGCLKKYGDLLEV